MVIEVLSNPGWGGLAFGLRFLEESLPSSKRPWVIFEASADSLLFPPSLSGDARQAMSQGKLLWMHAKEEDAPAFLLTLLECGLFEGVLVRDLENFTKSHPAAIWGRRWQLTAEKSRTNLIWIHRKKHPVLGFDLRLEWTAPKVFEVKKGHGYMDERKKREKEHEQKTHSPAA